MKMRSIRTPTKGACRGHPREAAANGPVGDVDLTFIKELTRFQDFTPEIGNFPVEASGGFDDNPF